MAEIISNQIRRDEVTRSHRRDWPQMTGVLLTILALSYVAASVYARPTLHGFVTSNTRPFWFPLELFLIAISPATVGILFLHWKNLPLSRSVSWRAGSFVLFGAGLIMAAWFDSVVQ